MEMILENVNNNVGELVEGVSAGLMSASIEDVASVLLRVSLGTSEEVKDFSLTLLEAVLINLTEEFESFCQSCMKILHFFRASSLPLFAKSAEFDVDQRIRVLAELWNAYSNAEVKHLMAELWIYIYACLNAEAKHLHTHNEHFHANYGHLHINFKD
nr:hypothetical protein [Tanacetum cinerariifolium]